MIASLWAASASNCFVLPNENESLKSKLNDPPPPPPLWPLTLTDRTQVNTKGMLIMPAHDISKISPPILFKLLSSARTCPLLHLGPLAGRRLFSGWGMGWAGLATLLFPPFIYLFIYPPQKAISLRAGLTSSCATVYLQFVWDMLQPVC